MLLAMAPSPALRVLIGSSQHKLQDLVCWRFLQGRSCIPWQQLSAAS
jgi:hypothetical protein